MPRFLSIGECMVELAAAGPGLYRRGFAGDTFNTAWYARRLLPAAWTVAYGSVIGEDRISDEMAAFMAGEGIDTGTLRRVPGRTVGLYMISVENGERSFAYWRSNSAARLLAADPAWLDDTLGGADLIHLSGITVAILSPEDRETLLAALGRARAAGAVVSFDTNLRPLLWESPDTSRQWLTRAAGCADIVLPSYDEETALFGDATPEVTVGRYRAEGAGTVIVKNGAEPITAWSEAEGTVQITPPQVDHVTDTTAAGDSFAAGYLAASAQGASLKDAIRDAASLSARVVQAPGALVPGLFETGGSQ